MELIRIALFIVSIFCLYSSIMAWVFYKENQYLKLSKQELKHHLLNISKDQNIKGSDKSDILEERLISLEKYVGATFIQDKQNETTYHIDVVSRRNKRIVDTLSDWFGLSRKEDDGLNPQKKESELKSIGCLNNELYELNKEIDKIESKLTILVASKAIKDVYNLLKIK